MLEVKQLTVVFLQLPKTQTFWGQLKTLLRQNFNNIETNWKQDIIRLF